MLNKMNIGVYLQQPKKTTRLLKDKLNTHNPQVVDKRRTAQIQGVLLKAGEPCGAMTDYMPLSAQNKRAFEE